MRCLAYSLTLLALMGLGGLSQPAQAQVPSPGGVGFRNDLKIPVIVQGWSNIKNMQRRGQPILVQPGKQAWENNAPTGQRFYTIYDANQPSRVLLRDRPVAVQQLDQFFGIRPLNGNRAVLQQEPVP